ncbi:MAG: cyclic nucleotide-binding domain-containing protein [Spirochaetales bacterium]|nr:cyclic nucleotide-binding domain-containing protein [Spirochaetales bacterium]
MSTKIKIQDYFLNYSTVKEINWRKKEYICREDEEINSLNLVISGQFSVFRTLGNGRNILYRIYLPGSIIGDVEVFLGSEEASCSVQCIKEAKTLSIPMEDIRNSIQANAEFLFTLSKGIARKLHENSVAEAVNSHYSLEARLAHYFLTFTDPDLKAQSLSQLSEWMGCSYRHLTRNLKTITDKGGIRNIGGKYSIADDNILKKLAAPLITEGSSKVLFEPGEKIS